MQIEKEIVSLNSEMKISIDSEIKGITDSKIKETIDLEVVEVVKEPEVTKQVSWLSIC